MPYLTYTFSYKYLTFIIHHGLHVTLKLCMICLKTYLLLYKFINAIKNQTVSRIEDFGEVTICIRRGTETITRSGGYVSYGGSCTGCVE